MSKNPTFRGRVSKWSMKRQERLRAALRAIGTERLAKLEGQTFVSAYLGSSGVKVNQDNQCVFACLAGDSAPMTLGTHLSNLGFNSQGDTALWDGWSDMMTLNDLGCLSRHDDIQALIDFASAGQPPEGD